jgi:hypothetical protein
MVHFSMESKLPLPEFWHPKIMLLEPFVEAYNMRTPADPTPPPIKEPPQPPENPDAPVREPDPDEPAQI